MWIKFEKRYHSERICEDINDSNIAQLGFCIMGTSSIALYVIVDSPTESCQSDTRNRNSQTVIRA